MNGQLDVLNCGYGHLQIKFDKGNEDDADKARRVIKDMLKRGYCLFVEIDGEFHKVKAFDPERDEYILKDPADIEVPNEQANPAAEGTTPATTAEAPTDAQPIRRVGRPRGPSKRLSMRTHRATAIGPTAGG